MPTLLAVDDNLMILECFRLHFKEPDIHLETASSVAEGVEKFNLYRPDTVILDMDLPDFSGLECFRRMRAIDAKATVIFLTGQGDTDTTIEAMSMGAFEYLLKPVRMEKLRQVVTRALDATRLMRVPAIIPADATDAVPTDLLMGRCPAMQEVYKAIGRVASPDVTALILGESGTGKELVARAIYHYSQRSAAPFLAINCAAMPESLLESELFGHEKGAFTGAVQRRPGKFEQCADGTIFLDEVGDMPPLMQGRLLRVLQERQFERVGGSETIRVNFRLIAATNRDLAKAVASGQFRADLFFRLSVFTI